MICRLLPDSLSCAGILIVLPSVAADGTADAEFVAGLTNSGISLFVLAIAGALLLSMMFRASATYVARIVTAKIGKRRIRKILLAKSPDLLDDFILPGAYGGLIHIDHGILTSGGILCIQSNHYNGIVSGGADEPQWTNTDGIHRRNFLNPLLQNEGRSKALQKLVPNVPIANLVVFTGSVQFTSPLEKNVIHVRDLNSYIAKFEFGPCKIKNWDDVWLTVKSAALTDDDSRKDFRAQLSFS